MGKNIKPIQLVLLYTIKGYSYFISPILGQNCRFYPSCSQYAQEALKKYGSLKGTYLTIKRLLKCHPWCIGGIDLLK